MPEIPYFNENGLWLATEFRIQNFVLRGTPL